MQKIIWYSAFDVIREYLDIFEQIKILLRTKAVFCA